MSLYFAPVANLVLSSVSRSDEGKASGVNNTVREVGGVFGVAVLASVFAAAGSYLTPISFVNGLTAALWVGAAAVGVATFAAIAIPPKQDIVDSVSYLPGAEGQENHEHRGRCRTRALPSKGYRDAWRTWPSFRSASRTSATKPSADRRAVGDTQDQARAGARAAQPPAPRAHCCCKEAAAAARLVGFFHCQGALAEPVRRQMLDSGVPLLVGFAEHAGISDGQPDEAALASSGGLRARDRGARAQRPGSGGRGGLTDPSGALRPHPRARRRSVCVGRGAHRDDRRRAAPEVQAVETEGARGPLEALSPSLGRLGADGDRHGG